MKQIRTWCLWKFAPLCVLTAGCGSAEALQDLCIPTVDCAAISSIETPANCTTCIDCGDNWGTCTPGGAACKRGALDLDPDVAGCEASASDAHGRWVMHSTGEAISSFSFNKGQFQVPMSVSVLAYDDDDPSCVPTASKNCGYTVRGLQLEIPDFMIPESTWSSGVATLSGPVSASDQGSGAGALAPMIFAFDVRQSPQRRIALSSALVSFMVIREPDPRRASVLIQANSIDFGGYEITDLHFDGELTSD